MTRYRNALPQLGGDLFLTDGGIETTLIFHEGLELPYFAAFHLFETPEGKAAVRKYFRTYAELTRRFSAGLILESATWRANADWGARLGYTADALAEVNRRAIRLLEEIRREYEIVGPRWSSADASVLGETAMSLIGPCRCRKRRPIIGNKSTRLPARSRIWCVPLP